MPIPDLPLFKHRDTVVTPADQNQFVTQFENTMDTLSKGVIPAMNTSISDINIHSVRLNGYVASQEVIFGGLGQILTIRHDSINRE